MCGHKTILNFLSGLQAVGEKKVVIQFSKYGDWVSTGLDRRCMVFYKPILMSKYFTVLILEFEKEAY